VDRPRRPLHSSDYYIYPDETKREYRKLAGIIFGVFVLSIILTYGRGWGVKYLFQDFLAVLLILSSAYKMFRLEVFVKVFKGYDQMAQKYPIWAYIFPFIELGIGADYLLSNGSPALYFVSLVFGGIGIYSKIWRKHVVGHTLYACLDTVVRLPISMINFVSSVILFVLTILIIIVR